MPSSSPKSLAADPAFAHCAVEKTMTYAIGRGPNATDEPYFDRIAEALLGRRPPTLGAHHRNRDQRTVPTCAAVAASNPKRLLRRPGPNRAKMHSPCKFWNPDEH